MSLVVSDGAQHAYCFRCQECGEVVIRLCDDSVAAKLSAIGVRVSTANQPPLTGRSTEQTPAFTLLDAVRFERILRDEDLVVRLITGD
jgi:hypothetical protein